MIRWLRSEWDAHELIPDLLWLAVILTGVAAFVVAAWGNMH